MVTVDVQQFEAFILDGVITQTASSHARAWKQLFDEFLPARQGQVLRSRPSMPRWIIVAVLMAKPAPQMC
jgi:beta-phosphoglucomutase-like phosphatase (HAD superfamily)